jgi:hypothetical protein
MQPTRDCKAHVGRQHVGSMQLTKVLHATGAGAASITCSMVCSCCSWAVSKSLLCWMRSVRRAGSCCSHRAAAHSGQLASVVLLTEKVCARLQARQQCDPQGRLFVGGVATNQQHCLNIWP